MIPLPFHVYCLESYPCEVVDLLSTIYWQPFCWYVIDLKSGLELVLAIKS